MAKQLWQIKEDEIESVYNADIFDMDDWLKACDTIETLERDDQLAGAEFCGHPLQDGFLSLFKSKPEFKESAGGLTPLKDLVQRGMETPSWKSLREVTVGQLVGSAFGAKGFFNNVLRKLPQEVKDAAKKAQSASDQAKGLGEKIDNLQNLVDMLERVGQKEQAKEASDQVKDLGDQFEFAAAFAEQAMMDYENIADENSNAIAVACNSAAGETCDEVNDLNSVARGFSLAAGGDGKNIDPETFRAAMEALKQNGNLNELAKWLGYAKRMVSGEYRKVDQGNKNMKGYHIREFNPSQMASSELVNMVSRNPAVRADFKRRLVDNQIVHRLLDGEEQKGEGPMILVRDESGSMEGDPHSLAVSLEWALLDVSRKQDREFYSIPFSYDNHVWEAPKKGKPDPQGVLDHLAHFYNQGTKPYPAIEKALDIVEAQNLDADILVITDESFDEPTSEFIDRCRNAQSNIVVVTIGGLGRNYAKLFANYTINVSDLISGREDLRKAIKKVF